MVEISDADILIKLRSVDSESRNEALEYLYDQYYSSIASHVLKNSGNASDAKDMFQESLIVFYEKAITAEFKLTGSIKNYLHAVCNNLWLKRLRKNSRMTHLEDVEIAGITEVPDHEFSDLLNKYPKTETLLKLVGESCRQVLTMFYFNRMNMKQIAAALKLSNEGVAKNKKARCMQKIKEIAKSMS